MAWPSPGSALPGSLAEAINLGAARKRDPPTRVVEDGLTFQCLRGEHRLPAQDAQVERTSQAVLYTCPADGALLCTIEDSAYSFSDADLLVALNGKEVSWWDYLHPDEP